MGDRPFIVYTDHASLRTAVNSPHLLPKMARWLSFFAEYNVFVKYKRGRLNVVADASSRRPDFDPTSRVNSEALPTVATPSISVPSSPLLDDVRKSYAGDTNLLRLMGHLANPSRKSLLDRPALYRSSLNRVTTRNGLLYYTAIADDTPLVDVPDHDDLRLRIMFECHDAPSGGHRVREMTYLTIRRDIYWPHVSICPQVHSFLQGLSLGEA